MEDLIVALKIVTPSNAKNTAASTSEENKENIQLSSTEDASAASKSSEVPMDVEQADTNNEKNNAETTTTTVAEVEMASDVDCSISEND